MKKVLLISFFATPPPLSTQYEALPLLLPLLCSSQELQYLDRPKTLNAARSFAFVLQSTLLSVLSLDWPLAIGSSFRPLAVPQSKKIISQLSFSNSSFFHLSSPPPNPLLTSTKEGHNPAWQRYTEQHGTAHPKCCGAHIKALLLFKSQSAL